MDKPLVKKGTSLAEAFPHIALQADGWNPENYSYGSPKVMPWICASGHKWTSKIGSRTYNDSGCPICSNKKLLVGYNDLQSAHPEVASEADGWDPSQVLKGTKLRKPWKCLHGHKWEALISSRISNSSSCPYCAGQLPIKGVSDLKTLYPQIASEAYGWNPEEVTSMSGVKRDWKCPKGHIYSTAVGHRASENTGCPYCDGKKILEGFNDLAHLFPNLAIEADGWDPKTISASTHKSMPWRCVLGHRWSTSPNARTNSKTNCPYCANKKVLPGFNDVGTTNPKLAAEIISPPPSSITEFSHTTVQFQCSQGHTWKTKMAYRQSGERGCPSCANSGFDPNKDGWLYFLRQENWGFLQIGISNVPETRLSLHSQFGWELIELLGPFDGQLVRDYERLLLKHIKNQGAILGKQGRGLDGRTFSGHTEAWIENSFALKSLRILLDQLVNT
jgi:hypothetical protein